jgi:signal transduction histidine kinase
MIPKPDTQGLKVRIKRAERLDFFVGSRAVPVIIWVLVASIFVFDVWSHPEDVSACFAYAIPVFLSLFELRPRPFFYAGAATLLSLIGSFHEPTTQLPLAAILSNRLIAVATLWLAAVLVRVQYRRHTDAERATESQRRFVNILSHEIGTPLTVITGQAQRIAKRSGHLTPNDLNSRADKIRKAAERIETIVDRVQFASSLGNGTIPIMRKTIDINAMMRQLTDQAKEQQDGRPIELQLCPEPLAAEGDEALLRQALENVIVNSMKYSSPDAPILVSTTAHGSTVRIAIEDRGNGISKHDLSRVAEPYYRGGNSKGIGGAGLGLYFVERIVEAHQGTIFIESEVGKGTKVTIDIARSPWRHE